MTDLKEILIAAIRIFNLPCGPPCSNPRRPQEREAQGRECPPIVHQASGSLGSGERRAAFAPLRPQGQRARAAILQRCSGLRTNCGQIRRARSGLRHRTMTEPAVRVPRIRSGVPLEISSAPSRIAATCRRRLPASRMLRGSTREMPGTARGRIGAATMILPAAAGEPYSRRRLSRASAADRQGDAAVSAGIKEGAMRGSKGGGAGNSGDPGACWLPGPVQRAPDFARIPREERRRSRTAPFCTLRIASRRVEAREPIVLQLAGCSRVGLRRTQNVG